MTEKYDFAKNDPFDKNGEIWWIVEPSMSSKDFMESIRKFKVPAKGLAIWFLGQNGFVLKSGTGPLIAIDPYLSNSCASMYNDKYEFRLDRQLPVFIEPEDFDVDLFLVTHSYDDHTDPATLARYESKNTTRFIGPWEAYQKLLKCGIPEEKCLLVHPNQILEIQNVMIRGTFALPTDQTDLNHLGFWIKFPNNITFYNSGDTAYWELYTYVNKFDVDICTICINGGFHNLSHMEAARIVKDINPEVVIPCHYDMMINNVGNPEMFRSALNQLGVKSRYKQLDYYTPWVFIKD